MAYKLSNVKREENGFYSCREGYLLKLKHCYEYAYNEDIEITFLSTQLYNKALFINSNKEYDVEAVYKKL